MARNLPESRRWRRATSGSTALPLELYLDRADLDGWLGSYLFFREWAGVRPGDTMVRIGGPIQFDFDRQFSGRIARWVRQRLSGELLVHLVGPNLSPAGLAALAERLAGRRYFIWSIASYAARLATGLLDQNVGLAQFPVAVITGAETLTEAGAAAIERGFRQRPVDHYSCWEVPHLAQSCPDNPDLFHVNSDRAIVRVVREDGRAAAPGEEGRVVITSLANYVMPLINYDLGDRAAPGPPCPCGRGFPTICGLIGRQVELLRTPAGRVISPTALSHFLPTDLLFPHVAEYQVLQEALDAVVLRLVPTRTFSRELATTLCASLARGLGSDISVRLEIVDSIPLEPSGKRLVIKSHLPPPGPEAA